MQKIISISISIFLFIGSLANAAVVIKSKEVSSEEFNLFLKQNPQAISLSQYYYNKWSQDMKNRQIIFEVGGLPEADALTQLAEIESQRRLFPLSIDEMRFIHSLAEKNLSLPEAKGLYCLSRTFSSSEPSQIPCSEKIISLKSLQKNFPVIQSVMIEGTILNEEKPLKISQSQSYNWVLLSDTHSPIQFFGTYDNLLQQRFEWIPIVIGNCDRFSVNSSDPLLRISARVYFSNGCLRETQKSNAEISFEKESRTAIWVTGAIVLGAIAYSLKDKRVTIDVLRF